MSHVAGTLLSGQAGLGRGKASGWRRAGRSLSGQPHQGCQPIIGPGPPPGSGMSGPGQVAVDLPGDVLLTIRITSGLDRPSARRRAM